MRFSDQAERATHRQKEGEINKIQVRTVRVGRTIRREKREEVKRTTNIKDEN